MDHSSIVDSAIHPMWWLLAIAVLGAVLRSPWLKGKKGEALVRLTGRLRLPSHAYRSVHNVTLQTPDGTTQIDHIVVSRFGVFVVETKHMNG